MTSKMTRKEFLKLTGGAALAAAVTPALSLAAMPHITTRTIPKTGEALPVIGLGTAYSFGASSGEDDFQQRKEVLALLLSTGAKVIDTAPAPSYGVAETIIGRGLQDLEERSKAFLATKISTFGKSAGEAQAAASFRKLKTEMIDLLQVHNLKDTGTHLKTIRALKDQGKVRYIGVTHYLDSGLGGLAKVIKKEPLDFVQCHYSALERAAERELLDLAFDKGVAVIVNRPFARGAVFSKTKGLAVPDWTAEELGIESWGQFFLKFALSHPAVTVAVPGTDKPRHMKDNLGAAFGPLPGHAQRARMIRFLETL